MKNVKPHGGHKTKTYNKPSMKSVPSMTSTPANRAPSFGMEVTEIRLEKKHRKSRAKLG